MTESAYTDHRQHRKVARAQPAPAGVDPIIDEFGYIRRNERFRSLPGLTRMQGTRVAIYGVGAVGRQVALGLATMGFKNLVLIDPDIVDTPNLGTQGYKERDYGKEKVKATAQGCKDRCRACKVVSAHKMVGKESRVGKEWLYSRPKESREEIAFLCVDDMITRQEIGELEELQPAHLLVDTRMGAYAARIIADVHPFERWKKTLFSDSAAFTGRCTLQSTYFMAAVCAGAAIATLWRYASAGIGQNFYGQGQGAPFEPHDFIMDMLDFDITHQGEPELTKLQQLEGNLAVLRLGDMGKGGVEHTARVALRREMEKAGMAREDRDAVMRKEFPQKGHDPYGGYEEKPIDDDDYDDDEDI